jgi:hypothetical protein
MSRFQNPASDFNFDDELAREEGLPGEEMSEDSADVKTIQMTESQEKKAADIRYKLRRAKTLFPDEPIFTQDRYLNMEKLHLLQLEEMWKEVVINAHSKNTMEPWTLLYQGGNMFLEKLLVNQFRINVSGVTQVNMNDPGIIHALKLLELEYGFQTMVTQNPALTIAMSTAANFAAVYQYNQTAPPPQPQQVEQVAAQAARPIDPRVLGGYAPEQPN